MVDEDMHQALLYCGLSNKILDRLCNVSGSSPVCANSKRALK